MRGSRFILFLLMAMSTPSLWAAGVLSVVTKDVWITKEGAEEKKARRGLKIIAGEKLRTGKDSYIKITMDDKNILHVGPETEMILQAYNTDNGGTQESVINVLYGRVRSALEKKYDGESSRYRVITKAAIMGVRGTDFIALHDEARSTSQTIVLESNVGVSGIDSAEQPLGDVNVTSGQMTTIVQGQPPTPPVPVPPATLENYKAISVSPQVLIVAAAAGGLLPGVPGGLGIGAGSDSDDGEEKKEEPPLEKKPQEPKEEKPEEEKKEEPKPEETKEEPKKESPPEPGEDSPPWSVALKAGTLGASVEVAYPLSRSVNLKLDVYNTFNYNFSGGNEDFYDTTIDYSGAGLLLELGARGAFQLNAGAYFIKHKIAVDGVPLGNEEIGNTSYNFGAGDTVVGDGDFENTIAPYLGVGWKLGIFGLFDFVGDIGAMYVGELKVNNLDYSGPANVSDADEELEIQEIEENFNKFKVWPVVRAGIAFSF